MTTVNIYEAIQHSYIANALYVLTKHAIFDALLRTEKSAEELAQESGLDAVALRALLELAVACGYLKCTNARFRTASSGLLLSKKSGSWLRSYLMVWGEQLQPAFLQLDSYATTGKNAFSTALGAPIWEYYGQHLAQHENFVDFMAKVTDQVHIPSIVKELKIGDARTLTDVGGGTGSLMCSLLDEHVGTHGTVYDQPRNKRDAALRIQARGMTERCDFVAGNMFSSVPGGADLYLIKHVLHDWDDSNVANILAAVSNAMGVDSTLVLIEGLMDTNSVEANPHFLHARNMEQRIWTEGHVRNSAEFNVLCETAGLKIEEIVHAPLLDVSYLYCKKQRL